MSAVTEVREAAVAAPPARRDEVVARYRAATQRYGVVLDVRGDELRLPAYTGAPHLKVARPPGAAA
jgi:hypothetical protein